MKKFANVGLLMLLVLGLASRSAFGLAMVMLDDGVGNSVTITDNGGCTGTGTGCAGFTNILGVYDLAGATLGQVVSSGSLGVWFVNVTTGVSKPIIGSATNPHMDMNSIDQSTAAGTLTIKFTDDNFGPIPTNSAFEDRIGGTTAGTIRPTQLYDAANGSFTGVQIADLGVLVGPVFSKAQSSSAVAGAAPFSLTQVVTITHSGAGLTSFDYEKTITPEPSALLLLGSGLAGFGYLRRRVFKR